MLKQVNPGPGTYRTDTDVVLKAADQVDSTKSVQDRPPRFSFSRGVRTGVSKNTKLSTLQPSYLNVPVGKSNVMKVTPGPGQYNQYTYFGGASGPTRTTYF